MIYYLFAINLNSNILSYRASTSKINKFSSISYLFTQQEQESTRQIFPTIFITCINISSHVHKIKTLKIRDVMRLESRAIDTEANALMARISRMAETCF